MMTFFFELKLRCALFLMLCNSSCRSVRNASKRQHFFLLAARKKKYLFHFVYIFDASKNFDFIFFLLLSHKIYLLSSGALFFFHGHFRCYQKLFRAKKQHKKSIYAKEEQKKKNTKLKCRTWTFPTWNDPEIAYCIYIFNDNNNSCTHFTGGRDRLAPMAWNLNASISLKDYYISPTRAKKKLTIIDISNYRIFIVGQDTSQCCQSNEFFRRLHIFIWSIPVSF